MSRDRGAASVLVLGAAAMVLAVSVPVVLVASLLASHRQAVRAADLAALAGAQHSLVDAAEACAWAARVATANGAGLTRCSLQQGSLVVVVTRAAPLPAVPAVTATARAGMGG